LALANRVEAAGKEGRIWSRVGECSQVKALYLLIFARGYS
jgi:hypothetical protein